MGKNKQKKEQTVDETPIQDQAEEEVVAGEESKVD
jgi:hypothetical protein